MRNYQFKPVETRDAIIEWIKSVAEKDKFKKVVLGISGGKDSTIAAALCCRALGAENVHGLLLPNGIQPDIDDSIKVCRLLGIKYDTINIQPIYSAYLLQYVMCTSKQDFNIASSIAEAEVSLENFVNGAGETQNFAPSVDALFNLPPRIRMSMIRLWGQTNHHRMCGTGNFSEITVGYCTKDGDTSNDFNPLAKITSLEVIEVGLALPELPRNLVVKTPSDGLCGKSDEEKLGVTYKDIHNYIRNQDMDKTVWNNIHKMELAGLHKRSKTEFIPNDALIYTA